MGTRRRPRRQQCQAGVARALTPPNGRSEPAGRATRAETARRRRPHRENIAGGGLSGHHRPLSRFRQSATHQPGGGARQSAARVTRDVTARDI